jgi:GT2 family glycosyltransferase
MNKKVAIILVNYKDYANKYLVPCLDSIERQDYSGEIKLYIVDNSSSEESFSFLQEKAEEAIIIRNENNDGFAKGNNDVIKKALDDGCDYIVLFNMDTVVDSKAVLELVKMAESDNKIGAVQSRLMLFGQDNLVNSLGNSTHFLGFGFCQNYQSDYGHLKIKDGSDIFYPSGAGVLFKSDVLREVGLFDEEYFMYNEDQDLGWRVWLFGYRCVISLDSVVYHKYEFSKSIGKYYFMDRNRIMTALKNYKFISLLILFPAWLIMELGLFFFSIFNGWFFKKIKVYLYFLRFDTWRHIIKERKIISRNRKIKDRDLVMMISGRISYQEVDSPFLRLGNFFLNIYFIFFRFFLRVFKI